MVESSTPCRPRQYQRWQQPVSISRYAPDAHYASPSMQHPGLTSLRFSIFFREGLSWPRLVLARPDSTLLRRYCTVAPQWCVCVLAMRGRGLNAFCTCSSHSVCGRFSTWPSTAESAALCWKIYRSPPRYFPFRPGFLPADRITRRVRLRALVSPRLRHLSRNTLLFFFLYVFATSNPRCFSRFGKHRVNDRFIERPTNNATYKMKTVDSSFIRRILNWRLGRSNKWSSITGRSSLP